MSTVHQLKTDPGVFQLSWEGKKPWEIRFDDRDYFEGDRLILLETKYFGEEMADGKPLEYTGRQIQARVTAVVEGYGLEKGWVVLSVEIECKQENKEYMPEVGEVCEISWRNGPVVKKAEITYMGEGVGCYKDPQEDGREYSFAFDAVQFYSIKSERDECVERMVGIIDEEHPPRFQSNVPKLYCEALYDAGYRLMEGA